MSGMKQNMEQWAAAGLPGEGKTTEEILRFIEEYCRDAVQKSKKVICFPELTIAPNPLGVTVSALPKKAGCREGCMTRFL